MNDLIEKNRLLSLESNFQLNKVKNMHLHYLSQIDSILQAKAQLLESKISDLSSKTFERFNVPDSLSNSRVGELVNDKLPGLPPEQYTTQLTEINKSIETYKSKISDTEELKWVEHYRGQLDQLEGVVGQYQDKLLNLEEIQNLKSYQQQLEQLSAEANGYFKEMQDIVSGGFTDESPLIKQLESKIGHYPEFQELQKVTAELERVKNMPQDQQEQLKSYQDPEKLKSKAKELVNNHFSQHQDKLKAAQQRLATFRKKYSSIETTKDMSTAVKRNSLEGKSLSERLVLGGNFQINPSFTKTTPATSQANASTSKVPTSVDISPLLGYKLNKKLTLGVGGTYRAILELDNFKSKDQVYGYRAFVQQKAIKSFFMHAEYENLSTASTAASSSDKESRSWQPGGLAGIGKEFSVFKQVNGQVMVLYNFLHEDGDSLYRKPWVIRFGFLL